MFYKQIMEQKMEICNDVINENLLKTCKLMINVYNSSNLANTIEKDEKLVSGIWIVFKVYK